MKKLIINKSSISLLLQNANKPINVKLHWIQTICLLTKHQISQFQANKYLKHFINHNCIRDVESKILLLLFKKPINKIPFLLNNALVFLVTTMSTAIYQQWKQYLQQHDELTDVYQSTELDNQDLNAIHSNYRPEEIQRSRIQQQEQQYIHKQGYKRDESVICQEINEIFLDIESNGDLNGKRKCIDCGNTTKWNDYHCLCNVGGLRHSHNHIAMLTKNIFLKKWIPEETNNNQELANESAFFKQNKHWLIPLRYQIHHKFVECVTPIVLDNPVVHTWPMRIIDFKPHVLDIINAINQQFKIQILPRIVFEDMYYCWMIRNRDRNKFEVRSNYKPTEIVSQTTFASLWDHCN